MGLGGRVGVKGLGFWGLQAEVIADWVGQNAFKQECCDFTFKQGCCGSRRSARLVSAANNSMLSVAE